MSSKNTPAPEPKIARNSRRLSLLALAAAALAAPLVWLIHSLLER